MNEKDQRLFERIRERLGDPPVGGPLVIDVRTTQFVRAELILLKALIGPGRPGLFISVDRPHQYMAHLLSMHCIDHRNLTFLDAVARFSADVKEVDARVGFLQGPRNIDTLPSALRDWSSSGNGNGFRLEECRFVMIDNLSTLLTFNGQQTVRSFIEEFLASMGPNVTVPLVVDRERTPNLYQMALSMGGPEVRMDVGETGIEPKGAGLRITSNNPKGGIC